MKIDAEGLDFRQLNEQIRSSVLAGKKSIALDNVNGQRYIGCGLKAKVKINIKGVAGNDLAAFMDGARITVHGNAQDAVGNTMNQGEVIIHGCAGDIIGYGMRGGRIFVRGDIGYRVGIHMKSFKDEIPVIVVGGKAGDFLGEYMAGGIIIVLGLENGNEPITGDFVGTGMHGGSIYIRGEIEDHQLGKEVKLEKTSRKELEEIKPHIKDFCSIYNIEIEDILSKPFTKLLPYSIRPYGKVYCY